MDNEILSIVALIVSAIAGMYTAITQSKVNRDRVALDKQVAEAARAAGVTDDLQKFAEVLQGRVVTLTSRVMELEKQRAEDAKTIQALTVELTEWKIKAAQLESDFADMSEKYECENGKLRKRILELEKGRK
jgi:uncharacterized coiled-coil protein SlyX